MKLLEKKGFTIIEVIAVIFIIAVLTTLLFPVIINQINEKKVEISKVQEKIIFSATELYISENNYLFQNNDNQTYCVKLETLVNDKKLKKPLIDINTKKTIPLDNSVKVTKIGKNDYEYEFVTDKNCNGLFIDTTAPSLELEIATTSTNNITIPLSTNSDAESGIRITICKYGTSSGTYTIGGTVSSDKTKCTINGLESNKTYYYQITTINHAGLSTVKTGSATTNGITAPTIDYDNSSWATSKKLTITYSGTNINSPVYFVKSTVSGTTNVALTTCLSTNPKGESDCTGSSVSVGGTITAGTWYKVNSGTSAEITITSNGSIYAQTGDGTNVKASTTATITKIDTITPSCSISVTSGTSGSNGYYKSDVTMTLTTNTAGESGLSAGISTSSTSTSTTNTATSGNKITITKSHTSNTTSSNYYGYVKTGTGKTATCNITVKVEKSITAPTRSSTTSNSSSITSVYSAGSATSGIASTNCYRTNSSGTVSANGTLSGNNCVFSGLSSNTTYYYKKCITSNAGNTLCSGVANILTAGRVVNFGYTGGQQTYKTTCNGTFKLEVWGAQGSNYYGTGGKGGYATGTKSLSNSATLYVYVGGQPSNATSAGYNGGGVGLDQSYYNPYGVYGSGGGGATDIRSGGTALSNRIIIAGGGGGSTRYVSSQNGVVVSNVSIPGGIGGGTYGGNPYYNNYTATSYTQSNNKGAINSTMTSSSDSSSFTFTVHSGSLGQGAACCGGGYWGGTFYETGNRVYSGSGGSGYTGGVSSGSMTSGSRSGNGYATITTTACSN